MNKIFALLLIIFISYSFEYRMRCFDDLDGTPTEKCYVKDVFNGLRYYDSCKNGKICTMAGPVSVSDYGVFNLPSSDIDEANYGVCAPVPFGGFEGSLCGDNAECFSNNCDGTKCGEPAEFCKKHSECEKGKYCSNFEEFNDGSGDIKPTNKCTDLSGSGGNCYGDYMCPPLHLCHIPTGKVGKCKKIGSVESEEVNNNLLCKSGYSSGRKCVTAVSIKSICKSGLADAEVTVYGSGSSLTSVPCRQSVLDDSEIPLYSDNSIKLFKEYVSELNDVEVKNDKKHANYGYIRYHYDKKKVKEALIKAMYPELSDEEDETAECLLDVVKQLRLSGEKIKLSSLLVFAFALLLI
jgi:hypothetical protein